MLDNGETNSLLGSGEAIQTTKRQSPSMVMSRLDFSPNGGLTYTVHTEGKRQVMLLTYRVEGEVLITDQPSDPKEERTKFKIRSDGTLVLLYEHRPSTYVRADESSAPFPAVNLN
jgi:hypothetical protein